MALDQSNGRGRDWLLAAGRAVLWLLLIAYTALLIGFFSLPKTYEHALFVFFRSVVFALACLSLPFVVRHLGHSRLFHVLLAYLGYMLATAFWSQPPIEYDTWREGAWQVGRLVVLLISFIVATVALRRKLEPAFEVALKAVTVVAGAVALVSIFYWYSRHPFPASRLYGLGAIRNPTLTAGLFGVFAVMACGYMVKAPRLGLRLAFALHFAVLAAYVVLTQSRAPVAALLVSGAVLLLGRRGRGAVLGLSVLAGVILLFALTYPELIRSASLRGLSYRPEIWLALLERIAEAPWFGHGHLAYRPSIDTVTERVMLAHNALLATLRDGGVLGLALLLALLGLGLRRALRLGRQRQDYTVLAIMVFALFCITVSSDRLIERLEVEWLLVWFPLGLAVADDGAIKASRA